MKQEQWKLNALLHKINYEKKKLWKVDETQEAEENVQTQSLSVKVGKRDSDFTQNSEGLSCFHISAAFILL